MGSDDSRGNRPSMYFSLVAPDGTEIFPKRQDGSDGRWRWGMEKVAKEADRIEWINGRNGWSVYYRIYATESRLPAETIWSHAEAGSNRTSKSEIKAIFKSKAFDTPKPEGLIRKVLLLATQADDIVLDSFLGSGTTSAVAQKMHRKWIGIELGNQAYTHCYHRLKAVVDGEQGGISKSVDWKGGGGFKFYTLAPSLLNQDKYGNWVISKDYDAQKLAAAMAKQEGFRYSPHELLFWKQGVSSEQDYIFTTTQFVTAESLDQIHDDMQPGESLLICCKSFQKGCKGKFANITIKKIPQMLLGRCEFGRDDYSLNIVNMPIEETHESESDSIDTHPIAPAKSVKKKGKRSVQEINNDNQQLSLFD